MRALAPLLTVAALALSLPAIAQPGLGKLAQRLNAIDPKTTTPADCEAHLAKAARLNGPDLLYAATVCLAADRAVEANFLLSAGQVRSMADLDQMVPAAKADSDAGTDLYSVLYFQLGGPGKPEVFQQPASRDRFFSLFDSWSPAYGPDYNPGWNVRRRPEAAAYQSIIAQAKTGRRTQLVDIARLYADEAYAALDRRFQDLQARNPGGFVEGAPDATLAAELMSEMDKRSAALSGARPRGAPKDFDPAEAESRFPPHTPASDETVLAGSADPAVQHCADLAERFTIGDESTIARVLVTQSRQWGVIWRGDLVGRDQEVERLTCTLRTSSSRPLKMGNESLPPLPAAGK